MADGLIPITGTDPLRRGAEELAGLAGLEIARPGLVPITELRPPPAPAEPDMPRATEGRSIGREFVDSLIYSLGPQNIQMLGAGIQSKGQRLQSREMHDLGVRIKTWGRQLDLGEPATMPPVEDLESLARWSAGALGQGLGSVTIPIAGGGLGALAGAPAGPKGALVGGVAGAFAANESVLEGEAFEQFRMEGVDQVRAATAAGAIAPAMAALDTLGLFKVLQGPLRKPKQALVSYLAKRMAHGATVEGVTESLQGVIREYTAADLTGRKDMEDRLANILEEGAAAALTGGVLGTGGGIVQRNRRADAKKPAETATEPPPDATPEPEPEPAAPEGLAGVTPAGPATEPDTPEFGDLPPEVPDQDQAQETTGAAAPAPEGAGLGALTKEPEGTAPEEPVTVKPAEEPAGLTIPTREDVEAAANEAAESPTNDLPEPTDAQKEAGNYKKGHIKFHGLDISIENPRGSTRSGKDASGQEWSVEMPAHYGYVRRTEGADGDHVDVYIGDDTESPRAFIVDQVDAETGEFDEHKVLLGYLEKESAQKAYDAGFSDGKGPQRRSAVTPILVDDFKTWLKSGDTTKPFEPVRETWATGKPRRQSTRKNRKPLTLLQYIARAGGIRDDGGELDTMGLFAGRDTGNFQPGFGMVAKRKKGFSVDDMGELLFEAGYFRERPTPAELLEAIDNSVRGKVPQYAAGDLELAETIRIEEEARLRRAELRGAEEQTRELARSENLELTPEQVTEAAQMIHEGGLDPQDAFDTILEREAAAYADETATEEADSQEFEFPGFETDAPSETDTGTAPREPPGTEPDSGQESGAAPETGEREGVAPEPKKPESQKARKPDDGFNDWWDKLGKTRRRAAAEEAGFHSNAWTHLASTRGAVLSDQQREQLEAVRQKQTFTPREKERKEIGTNADGQPLFEDEQGVRSYLEDGFQIQESVQTSGRGDVTVDPTKRTGRFLTEAERDQAAKDRITIINMPEAPAEPEATAQPEAAPEPAPEEKPGYGDSNTVFTKDAADAARALLLAKFNQAGAGIDPEVLQAGITLSGYHIEAGARSFADFSKVMVRQLGEWARPYLRSWYEGARYYPGFNSEGMSTPAEIDAAPEETADAAEPTGDAVDTATDDGGGSPGPAEQAPADEGAERDGGEPGERGAESAPDATGGEPVSEPGPRSEEPGERTGAGAPAGVPGETDRGGRPDTGGERAEPPRPNLRLAAAEDPMKEGRSPLQKARDNMAALELLNRIEQQDRAATPEEQRTLALYTGWGGIKGAFRDAQGNFGKGFEEIGRRLKEMLPGREYEQAERSIQYAHYTSEAVIRHMWNLAGRLGVKGGRILEPGSGIGLFAGLMPDAIASDAKTSYTGIEMDATSARIAKALFPQYTIHHDDFAKRRIRKEHYDFAIGNPPFANIPIGSDPDYAQNKFLLHDFFFAKTMDALKPGGILMFVTSAGTLNKAGPKAREYLAERADFLGAIRLPGGRQGAFQKSSNTEVTTDIIVLRKRRDGEEPGSRTWVDTENVTYKDKDGESHEVPVNKWFLTAKGKQLVLGQQGLFDTLIPNRYGVKAFPGEDLANLMQLTTHAFPADVWNPAKDRPEDTAEVEELGRGVEKENAYYIGEDGALRQVIDGLGIVPKLTKKNAALIRQLIAIRAPLREVMAANVQRDNAAGDKARAALNKAYDKFVQEHGPLNKVIRTSRRPTIVQQESARERARENARLQGEPWDEGDFRPPAGFFDKNASERARIRRRAREEAAAQVTGAFAWDEGSFNPAEMADIESKKYPNLDAFSADPEYFRLAALETVNEDETEFEKGPVFRENIIGGLPKPRIRNAKDAMFAVMAEKGQFDLAAITELYGKSEAETIEELGDDVFELPSMPGRFVPREDYLSGDVKTKLEIAREKAADNPALQRNVKALEEVIPTDLVPAEISVSPGAKWLPEHMLEEFGRHLGLQNVQITAPAGTKQKRQVRAVSSPQADAQWAARYESGSTAVGASEIFTKLINLEPSPKVTVRIDDREVTDPVPTEVAKAQYDAMANEFNAWWEGKDDFRAEAAEIYNEKFRRTVTRKYSGAHVMTPGVRTGFEWRPYQKDVIARIVQSGNTYMAHAVGSGKTSSAIGATMELRRLGLASKPMIVVPKAVLRQFAVEFQQLYPAANIAVADERKLQGDNRRRFVASVGLDSTLDAVILTHEQLGTIPLSHDFTRHLVDEEISALRDAMEEVRGEQGSRYMRSQIQAEIEKLEQMLATMRVTDQVFTFEEMGVDHIFVDEAQMYRKLGLATSQAVKGIATDASNRAKVLYRKIRYMRTLHPGRGVVFMSGTPIENTMGEAYNISRYLQEDAMKALGIRSFDAWAGMFGRTKDIFEPNAAGRYKNVRRFARFVNLPELKNLMLEVVDYISPDQLAAEVVRPELDGGERKLLAFGMSDMQRGYQQVLADRLQVIKDRRGPPKRGDDIELTVIMDGRKAAIDMRLIDPDAPNDPDSKLNQAIRGVFDEWKATANQPFYRPNHKTKRYEQQSFMRGPATQIIFASLGLKGEFSVVRWIRAELQRMGVPAEQVAFINDYNSFTQRQRLFNDMNEGKVRILIGHPKTLGTGVNVQSRLSAIHNLDPLWFPALDEQRVGRILRQGNFNPLIKIFDYATEGSFDTQMWQMMATKGKFIHDFWKDTESREMEDISMDDYYDQAKAIVSGDPRLEQLAELNRDIKQLEGAQIRHEQQEQGVRRNIGRVQDDIGWEQQKLQRMQAIADAREDIAGDSFKARFEYSGRDAVETAVRKEADELFVKAVKDARRIRVETNLAEAMVTVGNMAGLDLIVTPRDEVTIVPPGTRAEEGATWKNVSFATTKLFDRSPKSPRASIEDWLRRLDGRLEEQQGVVARHEANLAELQGQAADPKPFPQMEELAAKRVEAHDLQEAMRRDSEEQERREAAEREARQREAQNQGEQSSQRRANVPEKSVTLDQASQAVARIVRRWSPAVSPDVRVFNSWEDLPPDVLAAIEPPGRGKTIAGLLHDGTVYLFAEAHDTIPALKKTLMHEAVGHWSMQDMLGDDFAPLLAEVWRNREQRGFREVFEEVSRKYPGAGPDVIAEEMIAKLAEKDVKAPVMTRIYAAIRRFLRSLGLRIGISHADIRALLQRADRRMRSTIDRENERILRMDEEPDPVSNGRRVKVQRALDELRYMIAYHGSPHQFDEFSTRHVDSGEGTQNEGWGLYFTSKKGVAEWYRKSLVGFHDARKLTFRFDAEKDPLTYAEIVNRIIPDPPLPKNASRAQATEHMHDVTELAGNRDWFRQTLENTFHDMLSDEDALAAASDPEAEKRWTKAVAESLRNHAGWIEDGKNDSPGSLGRSRYQQSSPIIEPLKRAAEMLDEGRVTIVHPPRGSVHEVDLAPKENEYLLWDQPFHKQPQKVQDAFRALDIADADSVYWYTGIAQSDELIGAHYYHALSRREEDFLENPDPLISKGKARKKAASLALLGHGVRGTKYKSGSGDHFNYVIFDEADITIKDQVRYSIVDRRSEDGSATKPTRPPLIELSRPIESMFRMLTLPFGGRDAEGNLRISKPVMEATGKIVRDWRPDPNGRFRWLDKPIQAVRFNWLNRHGTPREFIAREKRKFADAYEIMQELVTFLEGLDEAGVRMDEAKALQEVLEGRDLNDERMARMAAPIRAKLDAYGRELVTMGLLPEQAYLRNFGKYLHRSYRKYEFDAPSLVKWGRRRARNRRRALRGDELMRRGRVHHVDMKRMLQDVPVKSRRAAARIARWEILDRVSDGGRVSKRVYRPVGLNVELLTPTAGKGWTSQGEWELRREKSAAGLNGKYKNGGKPFLWRDWTEEERSEMGEIRDARYNLIQTYELLANDIATGRFFEDIAANPAWWQAAAPTEGNVIDASELWRKSGSMADTDWVKVPDAKIPKSGAKRWGAIAGGYIRATIWRDLNELEKMQTPGTWGWMLRHWKANKTSRSPGVHFNNTMGNVILAELYDFTFMDMKRGLVEFAKRGQLYKDAVADGVFDSGYVRTELNRGDLDGIVTKVIQEVEASEGISRTPLRRTFELFKRLDRGMQNAYRWEDEVFRLVSYMHDRNRGVPRPDAALNAVNRFLNYDLRAPWPNALRRTVLPFLAYTYAFVPQFLRAAAQKPWKLAKIYAIGYALQAMAYEVTDGDEDEERRVLAERDHGYTWAGLPKMFRTPFTSGDDPIYIGMTRVLPGGGMLDFDKGPTGVMPEWAMVSGPITTAFEVMLNRQGFIDQPISEPSDTGREQFEKNFGYLWRSAMPNAFWIPGSWDQKRIVQAATDEVDMFGREYSIPVAAIRAFGPKLYPIDVDAQRTYRMFDIERELQGWRGKLREASMDYSRNRISRTTYNRRTARALEGLRQTGERINRIMGRNP